MFIAALFIVFPKPDAAKIAFKRQMEKERVTYLHGAV